MSVIAKVNTINDNDVHWFEINNTFPQNAEYVFHVVTLVTIYV